MRNAGMLGVLFMAGMEIDFERIRGRPLSLAVTFGFEAVFGAFAGGMIVGLATKGPGGEAFRVKIDAVCFGWLAPFFYIGTGIAFDVHALVHDATTTLLMPAFLLLFLLVRGLPALLYRADLPRPEALPFALSSGVASLGLVVVITHVGLQTKQMNPDIARALVAAALLSLLLLPTLTRVLLARAAPSASAVGSESSRT
jgi:Kef-type K+ transport system membrane component KefB